MHKKLPPIISFLAVFFLSVLSLSFALLLGWRQKDSVVPFVFAAIAFSIILAVIGAGQQISISDLMKVLADYKKPP
ncbi:MAG: hypothetical protein AB2792_08290 [Candidatus Thiodiazotropha sp.]